MATGITQLTDLMESAPADQTHRAVIVNPVPVLRVMCCLCDEAIAAVRLEDLRYPITGGMFGSPDTDHGYPAPFDASLTWEHMMCPHGRIHRPFVKNSIGVVIRTNAGRVMVPMVGKAYICDINQDHRDFDRSGIIDRTVMISEEEAQRIVRGEIAGASTTSKDDPPDISDEEAERIVRAKMAAKGKRKGKGDA